MAGWLSRILDLPKVNASVPIVYALGAKTFGRLGHTIRICLICEKPKYFLHIKEPIAIFVSLKSILYAGNDISNLM